VTCWHKADLDFFEKGEPEDHSAPDFPLAYDERTAAWYAEHSGDDPPEPPWGATLDDRSEAWLDAQWRKNRLRNISTEQANIWYASRLRRRRTALAPFLADPPEPLTDSEMVEEARIRAKNANAVRVVRHYPRRKPRTRAVMNKLTKKSNANALAVPTEFTDLEGRTNIPAASFMNALIAIGKLGVPCTYDILRDKRFIGGVEMTTDASGQLSDEACLALRVMCRTKFGFDPGKNNMWDAVMYSCRVNAFNPVKDYLDSLEWDHKPRIDTWLIKHMGAPDTPFVRRVGRMQLVASVRRMRSPGAKYDYMAVLESPEGWGKSKALCTLYGEQFFSDQSILGLTDKQLQETVRGRWGMEAADLSGMRKADVDHVKAQLSRLTDRSRPAYGRAVIDAPRSCVFWGSTNDEQYLQSQTGNRRFFPIKVSRIDQAELERDRDQLWAEASDAEAAGEDIMLEEALWETATAEQNERTLWDPWLDMLMNASTAAARHERTRSKTLEAPVYECVDGRERISSHFLATVMIGIPAERQSSAAGQRIGRAMHRHGWTGPKPMRIGGRVMKGFERFVTDPWE
jgi:hypothetical protein